MPDDQTFETNDIHVAALAIALNKGKFRGIIWRCPDEAVFTFRPAPPDDIVVQYLNGAQAPARTLFELLRSLRMQLNQTRPPRR